MKFQIFQIDAFAEDVFTGNPAAVVVLKDWIDSNLMLKIAAENNLSETAFIVKIHNKYEIRWFTPTTEVDLCGHATLAAGLVVLQFLEPNKDKVTFYSRTSGDLSVENKGAFLELDFPADELHEFPLDEMADLYTEIGKKPKECYFGRSDCMLVYETEKDIRAIKPNFSAMADANYRGVIVTAPGEEVDFVSRFFAPQSGIPEDHVTGSSFTTLIPYWKSRTGKIEFTARQLSERRGTVHCVICGDRVKIAGKAKVYLKGEIFI